jgi:hypothetical protein
MTAKTVFLDEATQLLAEAAKEEGITPSAWIRRATRVPRGRRLPESFFAVLGTWEDSREPEEILHDIRVGSFDQDRGALE